VPLTPAQRQQRARLAALSRWAKEDPTPTVQNATAAFLATFIDQVDPHRTLSESERLRRAEAARRAHMTRLAFLSSKARGKADAVGSTP